MPIRLDSAPMAVSGLREQGRVIKALMLRDIRTRFFGHGLGYLIMIAWPLSHLGILLAVFIVLRRGAPYGDSLVIFFATGTIPYVIYSYMARQTMMSLLHNFPLLAFPVVKVTSILFARAFLELLASILTVTIFVVVLWFCSVDFWPRDTLQAIYALLTTSMLGFGVGIINAVLAMAVKAWVVVFLLTLIVLYATSGIYFVPDDLPEAFRTPLSYNPLLQCIVWLRSAYYDGYGTIILDKPYAVGWGVFALFNGLLLERLVRGRLQRP